MHTSWLSHEELSRLLQEDVPIMDLTSSAMGFEGKNSRMDFFSREGGIIAGSEEALRLMENSGLSGELFLHSNQVSEPSGRILSCQGKAEEVFRIWKIAQNILEYTTGIARRTHQLVTQAKKGNPNITVAVTRKNFPGTKKLSIKGAMAGGAIVHRLGLSESILLFEEHRKFFSKNDLSSKVQQILIEQKEKKTVAEVTSIDDAIYLSKMGIETFQFDKMDPVALKEAVTTLKSISERIQVAAAGGINEQNAQQYSETGADFLVTSSVYHGKPADIQVIIEPC